MTLETVALLKKVNHLVSYTSSIVTFKDELLAILQEMAEVEFKAALAILQDAKNSKNPTREIYLATTHCGALTSNFSNQPKGFQ